MMVHEEYEIGCKHLAAFKPGTKLIDVVDELLPRKPSIPRDLDVVQGQELLCQQLCQSLRPL